MDSKPTKGSRPLVALTSSNVSLFIGSLLPVEKDRFANVEFGAVVQFKLTAGYN